MNRLRFLLLLAPCEVAVAQGQGSWGGHLVVGLLQLGLIAFILLASLVWLLNRLLSPGIPPDGHYAKGERIQAGDLVHVFQQQPYEGRVVFVAASNDLIARHRAAEFAKFSTGFVVEAPDGTLQHLQSGSQVKLLRRSIDAPAA